MAHIPYSHVEIDMNLKLLSKACEAFGLPLSREELRLFGLYLGEIRKWNAKVNLTAITEPAEIIVKHFLDSLALLLILSVDGGRPGQAAAMKRRRAMHPKARL